ncbi:formylmethanofuran dehydrogenase subunit E [Sporobacter termitidis DSM 10068]|uniref:Formylmethanofuran dehydrogenase subunit E n=1 Tax=Sporobacter termitidis DSM 10068 TaxID=1123282 RepID=A0A1M5ZD56_9FIRM|nr:FmdE family protein [Sporobacter termitidis]SHI22121.1 formylmethanofuran dehydrogenase subunit E [Sporobacter termitidis DSM 10068]
MTDRALWEKAVRFHGHECPGLAIGVRAAVLALEALKTGASEDEELVCVTENDACGVDGVQVLTGCTFGKGNLVYRGTGKQAFSFFNRKSGKKIRLYLKPFQGQMSRPERQEYILDAPADEIFSIGEPAFEPPEMARHFATVTCQVCGEGAPEHKIRLQEGKTVCLDCFKPYDRGL